MRRMTLGLAAAAVIAGSVGLAGKAEALPAYLTLNSIGAGSPPSPYLSDAPLTWYITSCSTGTTDVCGNLVMYADAGALTFAAAPVGGVFQPLSSVYVPNTVTDLTIIVRGFTGSILTGGPATISSAAVSEVVASGGGTGGSASVGTGTTSAPFFSGLGTIGLPTSGDPASISFAPVNNVQYIMDIPLTAALNTVTFGTPVPEPAAFGLLAMSLVLTIGARAYRAR